MLVTLGSSLQAIHNYRVLSLLFTYNTRVPHSDSLNQINSFVIIHLTKSIVHELYLGHMIGDFDNGLTTKNLVNLEVNVTLEDSLDNFIDA